jgi:hypothetical protein
LIQTLPAGGALKINQNPTRSLERILNQEFGGGTFLMSEGAEVILVPGTADQIQISQLENRLQVLVNGSDKFLLTESESRKFNIRGDLKNITIDPSVTLYTKKLAGVEPQPPFPGLISERDEQLGYARRMESSFETAVTRGRMMAEDINEDRFVTHIGKQMQRLLGEMGSAVPQQTAFRSEKDLVPFLTQFESIKAGFPFAADLKLTVQNIQKQINAGGDVNLEFLSSEVSGALRHLNKSTTLTQPGRIPFELHEIPPGETQRGALEKWGMINDAISTNDIERIAAYAGDPSMLRFALPAEKSAFLKILAGAQDFKREGIIQILQSAINAQEFKTIMDMAGADKIQTAFKENPAEFNLISQLFQSGQTASPFLQSFTPHQIFAAIGQAGRFDFQNPLLLATASPEVKASMIQALQAGYVSVADNRSIINILQSAMNKTEFDQIVNSAGGKAIGLALQDPISVGQWNRLAGAYDRMDLTTDFVEGIKYSGALLERFPFALNEPTSVFPLLAAPILRGQSVGDVIGILDTFMKDAGDWIGKQIDVFDRGGFVQAGLENLNRMMGELHLLNIPGMRSQLSSLFTNAAVGASQITQYLQNLASTSGLSEFDIRNLITQPLAFAFQNVATESLMLLQSANAFFGESMAMSVFRFGPNSAQVKSMKALIDRAQTSFTSFVERSQLISNLLSEALPAPADFAKSFAKFTSDFNANFAPIMGSFFPQTAEISNRLFEKQQNVERLVNKQLEFASVANPIASNISQLGTFLKSVTDGLEAMRNGSLSREFSRINQALAVMPDVPRDLIQLTKDTTSLFTSIHDGSYAKTLSEAAGIYKKYDDPVAELTKTTAEQGAAFLTDLRNGTFSKANEAFVKSLDNFQNNPGALRLNQFLERLTSFSDSMIGKSENAVEEATKLITDVSSGEIRGSFTTLIKEATKFRQSPEFRKLIDLLEGGGKFLKALVGGHLHQNMEMMNSRFGYTPAIAQIIERGQHLTSTATNVSKALVARDFERPIAQITKKSQAKTQAAKDIPDIETIFSQAATTFYALTEVDHMDVLWQYHRQLDLLNDKALNDSGIRQFEKQAQLMAKDPDLKKSLSSQIKNLRSLL